MKKFLLPVLSALLICIPSFGQQYKFTYYLNKDFASVNKDEALFIGKGYNEDSLFKLDCFYKNKGDRFMMAHFTDSSLSGMEGLFQTYYPDGKVETSGLFINGEETGPWIKNNAKGFLTDSAVYVNNKPVVHAAYTYYNNNSLNTYTITDDINNTYYYVINSSNGTKEKEVRFEGMNGVYNEFNAAGGLLKTRPAVSRLNNTAEYSKGEEAFLEYISSKTDSSVPDRYGAKEGKYFSTINFAIDTNGKVADAVIKKDAGFGTAQEALRVINASGPWEPVKVGGVPIKTYREQTIGFTLLGKDAYFMTGITVERSKDAISFKSDCPDFEKLFTKCDVPAEFDGDINAYLEHAFKKINVPNQDAIEISIAINSFGDACLNDILVNTAKIDGEALRALVSGMPRWHPGLQNGHPVDSKVQYLVKFIYGTIEVTREKFIR